MANPTDISINHSLKANIKYVVIGAIIGGFFMFNFNHLFGGSSSEKETAPKSAEKVPLYWVAPMDANYRRDKPGQSPMGMDLVAVYPDVDSGSSDVSEGVGTIRISSAVENNLGVRIAKASYQSLNTKIDTVGYVTYDQDRLVHIHPRVDGWIEKLYVKSIGDAVQKGQPLYDIYSPELVNAQEELLLALDRNNSRLISAAKDRLVALQLPRKSIEKLEKSLEVQQFITFYAPQDGVIENLYIREGFFVKPGTMLLSIGDLSVVWVEAEIFERQAAQVKIDSPVTMTLDYLPGREWQGIIDFIYPTLNAKTRTVKVRSRFNNAQGEFKPNMFAQVTLHNKENTNALVIPKEALIRTGNQDRVVLALGDGKFKSIAVLVGRFDNDQVEILSGLNEGEAVVSSAQFLLDSESSKTSDFKRMSARDDIEDSQSNMPSSVWVEASIDSVMASHNMLTLTHQPIAEWDWPEMTMDFTTLDSLNFEQLSEGMLIEVQIEKTVDGDYQVIDINLLDGDSDAVSENVPSATVSGVVNSVMAGHRMVNISRDAIEKWDRPASTVDFILDKNVDISLLSAGMTIDFTFEIRAGEFIIVDFDEIATVQINLHDKH
jgi:Cu(I)/Ag(I) efflux system membrane fusion protein